ncbi:hypothetical protein FACS1894187_24960 [Synergistales bacterium]|nr:hypothetical protein FACS1894187_24960 [Synergistales bacterium]
MSQDVDVGTYFMRSAEPVKGITVRAINALVRGGFETMNKLCAAPEERLKKVRNLGEKCFALALTMREQYASEQEAENKTL